MLKLLIILVVVILVCLKMKSHTEKETETMNQQTLDVKTALTLNNGFHMLVNVDNKTNLVTSKPDSFLLHLKDIDNCDNSCFQQGVFILNSENKDSFSIKKATGGVVEGKYSDSDSLRAPLINVALDSVKEEKTPLHFNFEKHESLNSYFIQESTTERYLAFAKSNESNILIFSESKDSALLFTLLENK